MKHETLYRVLEPDEPYPTLAYKGKGIKEVLYIHGDRSVPVSQLWYCSICGETYVVVKVLGSTRYTALCNDCEGCVSHKVLLAKTRITLPGSILMEGYNTIDELSEEMLRRELLLELRAMKLLIN